MRFSLTRLLSGILAIALLAGLALPQMDFRDISTRSGLSELSAPKVGQAVVLPKLERELRKRSARPTSDPADTPALASMVEQPDGTGGEPEADTSADPVLARHPTSGSSSQRSPPALA